MIDIVKLYMYDTQFEIEVSLKIKDLIFANRYISIQTQLDTVDSYEELLKGDHYIYNDKVCDPIGYFRISEIKSPGLIKGMVYKKPGKDIIIDSIVYDEKSGKFKCGVTLSKEEQHLEETKARLHRIVDMLTTKDTINITSYGEPFGFSILENTTITIDRTVKSGWAI